jgi:hypothetical protein
MKTAVFWALVLLNALLMLSFFGRLTNSAVAQQARPRTGDYVMIPGQVTGSSSGLVYIVDTTNSQLSAMTFDENAKRLVSMPKIDLTSVFNNAGNAQRGTVTPRR